MRCILVDLDGTLCDINHRVHHVKHPNRDWKAFFEGIPGDTLVEPIYHLLDSITRFCDEVCVVLCSGRPVDYYDSTVAWLDENEVTYEALFMRDSGDFRPDHVVKKEILQRIKERGFDPFIVIDDRQSVVDMWRAEGLVCLQCRAPDEEGPPKAYGVLNVMVGPSGAGKSSLINYIDFLKGAEVVSSDTFRQRICGDFRDQTRNDQVFAAVNRVAKAYLESGIDVVVDATHLKRKDRLQSVSLVPPGSHVRYIVVDRPLEHKKKTGGWRNELDFDLITKHHNTFQQNLKDILKGDGLPNVEVEDYRMKIFCGHDPRQKTPQQKVWTKLGYAAMYPDDGGLKEPVRPYADTFSAVTVLKKHFKLGS